MYKNIGALLIFATLGFWGCESDDELSDPLDPIVADDPTPPDYTSGTADFSHFVAVGNSLTAGFMDGALFVKGQENSFPNILAQQFALAGGGEFTQPTMNDDLGGLLFRGTQLTSNRFIFDVTSQKPIIVSGTPTTEVTNVLAGPFHNMGVPGAKSFHLGVPGYGSVAGVPLELANPYYARMATSPGATIIGDSTIEQDPTFFSLWIGNNDVLSYASSGGIGEDHNQTNNLDPTTYGGNDITHAGVLQSVITGLVAQLAAGDTKGILANIPDVASAPYFTTVPHNPIPLDAPTAAAVNNAYTTYNGGLLFAQSNGLLTADEVAKRTIVFEESATNALVIVDEYLTDLSGLGLPSLRQTTSDDLVLLTALAVIGELADPNNSLSVIGVAVPLEDKFILSPQEQLAVENATAAFNTIIANIAADNDLPLLDANAILNGINDSGYDGGNVMVTSDFVTGGAFSLDGIHPSPRGYAIIANEMIDLINEKYGSNLPKVNLLDYTGVYLN